MAVKHKLFVLLILLFSCFGIWFYTRTHPEPIDAVQILPTPTVFLEAKKGDVRLYPSKDITPGIVFPNVTATDVCTPGYSKGVRDVSVSTKKQVFQTYGISYPAPSGAYEVDHFIPLELGGSNDIRNLWPEPADPRPGFHEKDKVENYLHKQVCDGKMDLGRAQEEISGDWYAVYVFMGM
jgi:hypothetical protein